MPSPFPGMDPYLEDPAFWAGFHVSLIVHISAALNRVLPDKYFADVDEYVWLQAEDEDERQLLGRPDAFVTGTASNAPVSPSPSAATAFAPPVTVTLPTAKKKKHRFVKIVGPNHGTVVTVVELLSPSNKRKGEDREKHLAKRAEYLGTRTNLVEVDLLRAGQRMPMGTPQPPDADHYVFVCRGGSYPRAGVWPFTVRDTIPAVPVPLGREDPDVRLDFQPLVAEIYEAGRYATRIDYSLPPVPALRPVDAAWAADLLKKQATKKKKK